MLDVRGEPKITKNTCSYDGFKFLCFGMTSDSAWATMLSFRTTDATHAPANELAECPPKNKIGEDPTLSRELCIPIPQSERSIAFSCVSVSGPMMSDRVSFFFLDMTTLV